MRSISPTTTVDVELADESRIAAAIDRARSFVDTAATLDRDVGWGERLRQKRLRSLVSSPGAADFTVRLTDEVTRLTDPRRAARRFAAIVHSADISAFPLIDRLLLRVGARAAAVLPAVVMPLVQRRLRAESAGVILPSDDPALGAHLAAQDESGVRCNVNVLGEAIVGDDEASRRLDMVLERLARPDVDYVSVKISAICAGISVLAFDDTVERVADRLRPLYRAAAAFDPPKFVNLDMEEYRDLDLTVAVFRRVLDEPEFEHLDAGIVLQAYLPDVRDVASDLGSWAIERHARAGGRTKVRIVKGANLAMESVEAELAGWEQAPFASKAQVDANYKAVLDVLTATEFDDAVRVGLASHNLFDVAWALGLRDEMVAAGRPDRIEFEMLAGMAPSQAEAVRAQSNGLLMYSPVVADSDFAAAIAYLVRRLDENTSPENFLSHLFDLADDPARFDAEADRFAQSVRNRHSVSGVPRRTQDRSAAPTPVPLAEPFANAPDTDWTRPANRAWLAMTNCARHNSSCVSVADVDAAIDRAVTAQTRWAANPDRFALINAVGDRFDEARGRALATMVAEAGKTIEQGDPEVSEAIDFARYYARSGRDLQRVVGATPAPRGTVVVTPPWNFPFAIPAGGVLAALAAGNTVILKPAPQTRRTAALIAELCWDAGVPRDVLQFVPAADDDAGRRLVTHPDVDAVILTGASSTASMFHSWRPDLRLHAETSGKNALVITATADRDDAVADLVTSAFGHAGQKCSAASLAIVEAPLYDDPAFLERIRDAAATLHVGWPNDLAADVGPLIEPPGTDLLRALTELEPGESWLLEPQCLSDDRRLWSPGVRVGVRPGSWFARTECFGPVLGIIRAADLDHAIEIQNSTDFGLTAGLHALDPAEIDKWLERVEAGNLYVNRGITGAIVQRQPFGGWKRSVVGPTAKAGGPNYVATLCRWSDDTGVPVDEVTERFRQWWRAVGTQEIDATGLAAERNGFRYRPLPGGVAVRFGPEADERQSELARLAAAVTGCRLVTSDAPTESVEAFAGRLAALGVDRVRLVGERDTAHLVAQAAHAARVSVDDSPMVGAADVELPRWLREQSVTETTHRHGRIDPSRSSIMKPSN